MTDLIKINRGSDNPTVMGRDLHEFLEVKTAYKDWFPRMCEYGFTEGVDFNPLKIERLQIEGFREVNREVQDHQLTIDMAKQISMLQRNEKGKQARLYFINVEKAWNDPDMVMARSLQFANKKLHSYEDKIKLLENRAEQDKPKVIFADSVATAHTSILVGELAKILCQNSCDIGEKRLFDWLRENVYLIKRKGTDYNMPTQRSVEMGLFEVKETAITHGDGHITVSKTPKVTGKGQQYFINKFLGENQTE